MATTEAAGPSTSSAAADPVHITISRESGAAFIWTSAEAWQVRAQHGIVGLLVGSLPLMPQQNVFLGLPLSLFDEEVVYLVRQGAAVLVDEAEAHMVSSQEDEEDARWVHTERAKDWEQQQQRSRQVAQETRQKYEREIKEKKGAVSSTKEEAIARRQERKERKKQEEDAGEGLFRGEKRVAEQHKEGQDAKSLASSGGYSIHVPTDSNSMPWYRKRAPKATYRTLSEAARAGLWTYPRTAEQRARCAVFEALRAKGYFMSKGLRFGGDLVVYPGDPLRYHSHFTATVQTTRQEAVPAQELVAAGRLGTAVKKAHVLCSVHGQEDMTDEDKIMTRRLEGADDKIGTSPTWGDVDFFSLTWAGFGT